MRRQRARHAIEHAGPEAVTVAGLQARFEWDEDNSPWTIRIGGDIRYQRIDELMGAVLADADLTLDCSLIPDGTPFLYDFHLGDLRNRAGGAE